jgi:hypothetical protein
MTSIRRLSPQEASEKATSIAPRLAEISDMKGWDWELGKAEPDRIKTETVGRVPRYWTSSIQYSKKGAVLDGPGTIRIDLQSETASREYSL